MPTVPHPASFVKQDSILALYTESLNGLPYTVQNHVPILLETALAEQREEFFTRIARTLRDARKIGNIALAYAYNALPDAMGARRAFVIHVVGKGEYQSVRHLASAFSRWPIEEINLRLPLAFYIATKHCTIEEKRDYIRRWFNKGGLTVEKIKKELGSNSEGGEMPKPLTREEKERIERFTALMRVQGMVAADTLLDTLEGWTSGAEEGH